MMILPDWLTTTGLLPGVVCIVSLALVNGVLKAHPWYNVFFWPFLIWLGWIATQ